MGTYPQESAISLVAAGLTIGATCVVKATAYEYWSSTGPILDVTEIGNAQIAYPSV